MRDILDMDRIGEVKMKKIKEILKNCIFGIILSALICGGISVYAITYFPSNQTTYDNSTSGMISTNVQDAIDELYSVCK